MSKIKDATTPKCNKCKGRTALISGIWSYEVDEEPYISGVEEESKTENDSIYIHGYICDKCGNIQGVWDE